MISFDDLPEHVVSIRNTAKRRPKPSHLREKPNKGKIDYGEFICWDGEGLTSPEGLHNYVLLANSLGLSIQSTIARANGIPANLSTHRCLKFFAKTARDHPRGIHVIYFGSYDFNMLIRDLPIESLERLRNDQPTYFGDFSLRIRFGKSLWLEDRVLNVSMTLWDVGSFFQQSFVKTLRQWNIDVPYIDEIEAQKANRATFTLDQFETIKRYCFQELESFSLLMTAFRDALLASGLRIQQWHGPGAIASYLFKKHHIDQHMAVTPDDIQGASQHAFGAGRIELGKQGHERDTIHNYDIRSAYPAAISNLPSLSNASWKHVSGRILDVEPREFSLYSLRWNFRPGLRFYPLRHRRGDGTVCYPRSGNKVWCWTPEYELCQKYFPGEFDVLEAYIFNNRNPSRPFQWVEDVYEQRMEWKRQGYGAERALKLGPNSIYGKMVQQLGWKPEDPRRPKWHQLEWGGYVTSVTRAALYDAVYSHQDAIISLETDGILSTRELPLLLSEKLGGWEHETYQGITYVQTGFYFLGSKVKCRGFDKGTISEEDVLSGWANRQSHLQASLTRHVGLNYAAHTGHWEQWGNWVTSDRQLDIASATNKRIRPCPTSNCSGCAISATLDGSLHDTEPYPDLVVEPSAPYPLLWNPQGWPSWKIEEQRQDMELVDYDRTRFG